jgi:hypothetical protein
MGTQIVLFTFVEFEHGEVPYGHLPVSLMGLVAFPNGTPSTAPQILVPLN